LKSKHFKSNANFESPSNKNVSGVQSLLKSSGKLNFASNFTNSTIILKKKMNAIGRGRGQAHDLKNLMRNNRSLDQFKVLKGKVVDEEGKS
jgi:hypothetical protein